MIKDIMMAEVVSLEDRHRKGRSIIEKAGDYAPAWGMIGTLVGLVMMLQTMDDPTSLGPSMSLALLTTLYGVVLANLVFNPIAKKLENKTEEEVFFKQLIIEGVISIQSGQNPQILKEKLSAYSKTSQKKRSGEQDDQA